MNQIQHFHSSFIIIKTPDPTYFPTVPSINLFYLPILSGFFSCSLLCAVSGIVSTAFFKRFFGLCELDTLKGETFFFALLSNFSEAMGSSDNFSLLRNEVTYAENLFGGRPLRVLTFKAGDDKELFSLEAKLAQVVCTLKETESADVAGVETGLASSVSLLVSTLLPSSCNSLSSEASVLQGTAASPGCM